MIQFCSSVCLSLTMVDCAKTIRNDALVTKRKYISSPFRMSSQSPSVNGWNNDYKLRFEVSIRSMYLRGWRVTCRAAVSVLKCHEIPPNASSETSCQNCKWCDTNVWRLHFSKPLRCQKWHHFEVALSSKVKADSERQSHTSCLRLIITFGLSVTVS
jgi:hypothetical protein